MRAMSNWNALVFAATLASSFRLKANNNATLTHTATLARRDCSSWCGTFGGNAGKVFLSRHGKWPQGGCNYEFYVSWLGFEMAKYTDSSSLVFPSCLPLLEASGDETQVTRCLQVLVNFTLKSVRHCVDRKVDASSLRPLSWIGDCK
eukprot:TRINITY_DN27497_c0_g1_i1.p1 TRINITY_DN27497_c0_g1~~TRINITY_DN27497_c0_g1_i1.p1  ORF type:complete len:158 (+),score=4.06 TRINITY_DN27497_c0_g1_i1:35-475(+)